MDATAVTQNACKLCSPLGASLAIKGIEGAVVLLHGSQGCSTYIRRYMISHFKEPIDIASSNFSEESAVFGGGNNIKTALDNITRQYKPQMIGVATTCLAETIGDDVPGILRDYAMESKNPVPTVHISTPSYRGSHADGFHETILQVVMALAGSGRSHQASENEVNLMPGMLSPADLRYLKQVMIDFGIPATLLPDYSQTLDGVQWDTYQKISPGGTPVQSIRRMGSAAASIEFGRTLVSRQTAGDYLQKQMAITNHPIGLPIGINETDRFMDLLERISRKPMPHEYTEARGRLIDAYVDGHKYVSGIRAAVYGEEDLVVGLASFMAEIGVHPVVCASGGNSGALETALNQVIPGFNQKDYRVLSGADFMEIGDAAQSMDVDLMVGNSKGYSIARQLQIPLVRVGFPIHDRFGGARILHVGYHGAQQLFDRLVNSLLEYRQQKSDVGYTYM